MAWTHILVEIGNRWSGVRELCCTIPRTFQVPNPDGQGSTLPSLTGNSRSENRRFKCRCSLLPQTSERRKPDLTLWRHVYPISARGSSCHVAIGISRIVNPRYQWFMVLKTPKFRTPISRGTWVRTGGVTSRYRDSGNREFPCR
jgi:hypothetical protein